MNWCKTFSRVKVKESGDLTGPHFFLLLFGHNAEWDVGLWSCSCQIKIITEALADVSKYGWMTDTMQVCKMCKDINKCKCSSRSLWWSNWTPEMFRMFLHLKTSSTLPMDLQHKAWPCDLGFTCDSKQLSWCSGVKLDATCVLFCEQWKDRDSMIEPNSIWLLN